MIDASFSTVFLVAIGMLLFILVLRFVQPELIYGFRQALVQIKTNKVFLDYEAGRSGTLPEFQGLLIQDSRYESLDLDEEYVFQRIDKIRELYRTLDPRRPLADKTLTLQQKPQICILELAALIESLERQVISRNEYHQPVISGRGLLTFIANEIRRAQGELNSLPNDDSVSEWFSRNPLSIEQTIEIMIAAAYGLALRQRFSAQQRTAKETVSQRPLNESALWSILETERHLRFLVRTEYQKRHRSEEDRHKRIKAILGEKAYGENLRRMEESRGSSRGLAVDFLDFVYFGQLETLVFGEWEAFRNLFLEKSWLKQRIEKIIQVRNELAHARLVDDTSLMLTLGYCGEIDSRTEASRKG